MKTFYLVLVIWFINLYCLCSWSSVTSQCYLSEETNIGYLLFGFEIWIFIFLTAQWLSLHFLWEPHICYWLFGFMFFILMVLPTESKLLLGITGDQWRLFIWYLILGLMSQLLLNLFQQHIGNHCFFIRGYLFGIGHLVY